MSDLDKAREWAESLAAGPATDRAQAAARIIQSLPNAWVDVEKVREFIEEWRTDCPAGDGPQILDQLEALITPKLPTLADMTQEEREACKWMQCEIDGQLAGILARTDEQRGHIWDDSGYSLGWKLENITPLPDLPKLEWPGDATEERVPQKLSTQQDYRNAPVGTVVKHRAEGADVFIKTRELIWRNINTGEAATSFKMSGDIREIVTVIEVK